jgi:hypothetical protein
LGLQVNAQKGLSDDEIARLEAPYISVPVAGLLEGTRFIGPVTVKN